MSEPCITYSSSQDATAERERASLATAFRVLFEEEDEQADARHGDSEEGKEIKVVHTRTKSTREP